MTSWSRGDVTPSLARLSFDVLPIGEALIASLGAVGCFAVIATFCLPFSIVLGKLLLLLLALACIGGIAICAKWHGVISDAVDEHVKTRINT